MDQLSLFDQIGYDITPEEADLLSGLATDPAFQLLMKLLDGESQRLILQIATVKDERELVRLTRFFQVFIQLVAQMRRAPHECHNFIERLRLQHAQEDPMGPPELDIQEYRRQIVQDIKRKMGLATLLPTPVSNEPESDEL